MDAEIKRVRLSLDEVKEVCLGSENRIAGFILYTRAHSNLVKLLQDEDRLAELDERSGPYGDSGSWPIFSVKLEANRHRIPSNTDETLLSDVGPTIRFIVSSWNESSYRYKKDYTDYFDLFSIEDTCSPYFVVFIWKDDDTIDQVLYKLSDRNEQKAFDEIREVIAYVSDAERAMEESYKKTEALFRNAKGNIEAGLKRRRWYSYMGRFASLLDFFSSLRSV